MIAFPNHLRLALSHVEINHELVAHLAAVIVKGGSIVSVGKNRNRMHSYVMYFADHAGCSSVHAELDAIFRVRRKSDLTGCKMYVARKTKQGKIGLAAPCNMCTKAIQRYGIKRVIYTIDDLTFATMRIKSIDVQRKKRR